MRAREKQTKALSFWCTRAQYAMLVAMAVEEGRSVASMQRRLIVEGFETRNPAPEAEAKEECDG